MKKAKISRKSSGENNNMKNSSFLARVNDPRPSKRKPARRRSALSYVDDMDMALTAEERNDLGI